jgi:membrane associated rhomboid family serine protease
MKIVKCIRLPLILLASFWLILLVETGTGNNFGNYGIYPRTVEGLKGILFSPFLHGSFVHLISNSLPFLILGTTIVFFYNNIYGRVLIAIYLLTGIGVWLIARPAYHIGASGVIYGFAGFLIFSGLFRREFKSILISIVILIFYGGLIWGVFPGATGVSWESHLVGGIVGLLCAYVFRKEN